MIVEESDCEGDHDSVVGITTRTRTTRTKTTKNTTGIARETSCGDGDHEFLEFEIQDKD